jgi:hypothetical protein
MSVMLLTQKPAMSIPSSSGNGSENDKIVFRLMNVKMAVHCVRVSPIRACECERRREEGKARTEAEREDGLDVGGHLAEEDDVDAERRQVDEVGHGDLDVSPEEVLPPVDPGAVESLQYVRT